MSKANPKICKDAVRKHTIKFDETFAIADGAPGYGTAVISGLPEGNILVLGAVMNVQFTAGAGGMSDTWDGDFSLGSAADADGSLAAGEVDLIASTATVQAVAGVSSGNRGATATAIAGLILDNTQGDLELNLNLIVDDADIDAVDTCRAQGVLYIVYAVLGDD